jgi:hypothetical protein
MGIETTVAGGGLSVENGAPAERSSVTKRSEILAGLDKLGAREGNKSTEKPALPKPAPAPKPKADDTDDTDETDDGPDDDTDDVDATDAAAPKPGDAGAELGPEAQQRIKAIQRAEKRSKDEIARLREEHRAEADRVRSTLEREWRPRIEAAQKLEGLIGKARTDVGAVIELLGLKEDDLSPLGRALYLRSPQAKASPADRAAADQALREHEGRGALTKLQSEIAELRKERETERAQADTDRTVQAYLDGVVKKIGDDSPLVKQLLEKNPTKTRQRLQRVAARLWDSMREEFGETAPPPKPPEVIRALEARRQKKEARRTSRQSKREDSFFEKFGLDGAALRAKKSGAGKAAAPSKAQQDSGTKTTPATDSKSAKDAILALMPD